MENYITDMEGLINLILSTKSIINNEEDRKERFTKGPADYVTMVDLKVQNFLKDELARMYPDYQFMGEEGSSHTFDLSRPVWILDPIDGTTNLTHGYPECAVSLGLAARGEIQAGIVYNPFTSQLFTALKGKGAFENGRPIHTTSVQTLEESLIEIGTSPYNKKSASVLFDTVRRIFLEVQDIRRCGSAAMALCNVAKGIAEAYFEPVLNPWDYAAGSLILSEAGGLSTDMGGRPLAFSAPSSFLAANGEAVHGILLPYMNDILKKS